MIGKNLHSGRNALVFAGYDYLQEQEVQPWLAVKEVVSISGMDMNATFSLKNRYSICMQKTST
ncbi:hypothetical protein OK016_12990 [Vibrio chagasii]|nr:hypothetical protein [Vibrio chagasii]